MVKLELWQHQKNALDFIEARDGNALLQAKMGLGKTLTALEYISRNRDKLDIVVVVSPLKVIEGNVWESEIDKHGYNSHILFANPDVDSFSKMTVKQKAAYFKTHLGKTGYFITPDTVALININYDIIYRKEIIKVLESVLSDRSLLILDESHRVKNSTSRTNKALYKLISKTKCKRLLLTGTPDPNSLLDFHGQVRLIDDKLLDIKIGNKKVQSGKYKTHFENTYGRWVQVGSNRFAKKLVGINYEDELVQKLANVVYKADGSTVQLPQETHRYRTVPFTVPAVQKLYYDILKEYTGVLPIGTDEYQLYCDDVFGKISVLRRIAGGTISTDKAVLNGTRVQINSTVIDDGKLSVLKEVLEDVREPVVVFCRYRSELDAVRETVLTVPDVVPYRLDGTVNELRDWKRSTNEETPVLIVQQRAGGEGIDLTKAGLCVFYSLEWDRGLYLQSIARLARPNSDHDTVRYIHLVRKNTVDQMIYDSFDKKESMLDYWHKYVEDSSREFDENGY